MENLLPVKTSSEDAVAGGGDVRGAARALLEDGAPGPKGRTKGDAESRDREHENETKNSETKADVGQKNSVAKGQPSKCNL